MTLAERLGSTRVELLHAYQVDVMAHADFVWIPTAAEVALSMERAERSMKELLEQQRSSHPGVPISSRVAAGVASEVILAAALADAPDLVVQGTHGRGFWSQALLGSVANRVVATSAVPVLSVRATDPPIDLTSGPARILVPNDFSPHADRALDLAVELARGLGSAVRMVFCYRHPQAIDGDLGVLWMADVDADAKRLLEQRVEQRASSGVPLDFVIHRGTRARGIVREAELAGAGLIVMGVRRHNAVDRLLLGNTPRDVIRLAPCPVITWGAPSPTA